MKNIVIIGGSTWTLIKFRKELIQSWIAEGHNVIAMSPAEKHNIYHEELAAMGAKLQSFPLDRAGFSALKDIKTILWLRSFFKKSKPDIIFSYQVKPVIYSSLASIDFRAKHYAMISGLGIFFSKSKNIPEVAANTIIKALYKIALLRSRFVFFQNNDDRKKFIEQKIVSAYKSGIVNGSGINLEQYSCEPLTKKDSSITVFLLMARLIKDKGILEYVEAAKQIHKQHPNRAIFQLLGDTDANPNSIKISEVRSWAKEGYIEYLGHVSDVRPHLKNCHVFVLPSSYGEGVPHSILEAMATGRAILTTNNVGCKETVIPYKNGLLIPPQNTYKLKQSMLWFMNNRDKLDKMGYESRLLAEKKFNVKKVIYKINIKLDL